MKDVTDAWNAAAASEVARRHIYPPGAQGGDAYGESGRETANGLAALIGPAEGITVVDFGAGDGRVAIPMAELGYNVVAVDSSPTMLERLRARGPIPTVLADGSEPLALKADVIYALAVLIHHRQEDAHVIVENLAEALRPRGRLILDLPVYEVARVGRTFDDVNVWTLDQLEAVAHSAVLSIEHVSVNPGAFSAAALDGRDHTVVLRGA